MEPNLVAARRYALAVLTKRFGSSHFEEVLDAVQEAMFAALQSWPKHGAPEKPEQWILTVANRRLIDGLRRAKREVPLESGEDLISTNEPVDELGLFVMACSPVLNQREQICLILRTLAGLPAVDIARLLHESEEAVQRRITRCKEKLVGVEFGSPREQLAIPTILLTLYLLFTEGYETGRGDQHFRPDLAYHALRLAEQLAEFVELPGSELCALLALMHLLLSRFGARVDDQGVALFFADYDPAKFDQQHIRLGFHYLALSRQGEALSRYHLEAALAASVVAGAPSAEQLMWHQQLVANFPTPMARLSLAIATGVAEGPEKGLAALDALRQEGVLKGSPHLHAARGNFLARLGRKTEAIEAYQTAIAAEMAGPIKKAFEKKIEGLMREGEN